MSPASAKPISSTVPQEIETPRPSASLIVLNNKNEVLLVHRNPQTKSFAGVHVFPGGNFDINQDSSLGMTAIRETFEETGILLASPTSDGGFPSDNALDAGRSEIHQQKVTFRSFLVNHQLRARTDALLPFTQWVTPPNAPRRFHTQFFIIFLSSNSGENSRAGFSSGNRKDRIPKSDGGQEVISARYIHPDVALQKFSEGKILFMPPQYYILSTIARVFNEFPSPAEQKKKIKELSLGTFGRMVINPRELFAENGDGKIILTYEGDETRGGPKGRLHRTVVKLGKGGITTEINLQRNFDIFTDIQLPVAQPKL